MSYRGRHNLYGHRKAKREGLKPASQGSIAALLADKPFMDAFTRYMHATWDARRTTPAACVVTGELGIKRP